MRAVVLAGLLVASATVAAQVAESPVAPVIDTTLITRIAPPETLVVPLGPFLALPFEVRYVFQELYPSFEETEVTLAVADAPAWAVATVSPSTIYAGISTMPCGCEREVVLSSFLLVSATHLAPAFRPGILTVRAEAASNGAYRASEATAQVDVTPDYFPRIEAYTPEPIRRMGSGEAWDAPVRVTNFGNGASTLRFTLEEEAPGFAVTLPPPFALGASPPGDPQEATVGVRIEAPARSQDTPLTLAVTASSAEVEGGLTDQKLVSFVLKTGSSASVTGNVLATPAPPSVTLLGLAALAAAFLRRP